MGKILSLLVLRQPYLEATPVTECMAECNFSRLVVMEGGRMVGILSKTDLLRALQVWPGGSGT